ncbi:hypothetical protein L6V77_00325 [Myxococcota bacterium]|nr:hypothetical protein [Myxococcota bacterium]
MRSSASLVAFVLLAAGAGSARAQASPVATLWREWTQLEAEWRAERVGFADERQRHRSLRAAASEGRDPRVRPATRVPRPAGPKPEAMP